MYFNSQLTSDDNSLGSVVSGYWWIIKYLLVKTQTFLTLSFENNYTSIIWRLPNITLVI